MVTRCLFFISIFICIFLNGNAQKDSTLRFLPTGNYKTAINDFTTDNLGNLYILSSTGQIKKMNAKGDSLAVFNDVRKHGKIYSIDATNPLKVLVYYKDYATIVVLDRLLNLRNTIDLRRQNILQVRAVTSSYDNNIWLYDELDSRLKKIDDNGNVLLQTADFRQLYDSVPTPEIIYDRDGQLYLYDPKRGLLVFDYYGAQKNNIQLKNISDLQVIDKNNITGRDQANLILYKPASLQLYAFKVSMLLNEFRKIRFTGNHLYALSKEGMLRIFQTP